MRIHFQEKPWDLYLAIGYTLLVSGILLITRTGNFAALLLVLFVPGYVLVAALFPGPKEIDWIERVALSLGLSIAIVPLLGLALNFTPLGIRFEPIIAFIAAFAGSVGILAYWRRLSRPTASRLSLNVVLGMPEWQGQSLVDKGLTVALVASIVVAAGTVVYVLVSPRPGERFTDFYLLNETGVAGNYPTRLNVSEPGTVIMGVENHEGTPLNYTIRVDLVGLQLVWNQSAGRNDTVETNRSDLSWLNLTLDHDRTWTQAYSFVVPYVGLWKVQFLLFRDLDLSLPYRSLQLRVTVGTGGGSIPEVLTVPAADRPWGT